jgi:dephospho-CoA kinase
MSPKKDTSGKTRGLRVGLTGGIGCGKSTAAGFFAELGFGVIDADAVVRELWEQDGEVQAVVRQRWGGRVEVKSTNAGGKLDRRKVAEIVFADPAELVWLEELLHPRVRARWQAALAAVPEKDWVVEIPLLFEKSLASEFDFTLCIEASPVLQAERLAARGLSLADIAARQARQWPLREKIERADAVALNDGNPEFLRRQIVRLAGQWRNPAP